ncbi:hypothetical protein LEP1GSC024_0913 [Leptospira noguchii str. 2001034031]|uniref:Uncharacterized protein n=1 Tax=Leptospira noguchii str. 2001034031 TaxID=1193053 RepID=M6Y6R3_9LEPT|nr:hypothetical protein LEP1GSC024_0913 [Leptospira noguchii str. 2001034031]
MNTTGSIVINFYFLNCGVPDMAPPTGAVNLYSLLSPNNLTR